MNIDIFMVIKNRELKNGRENGLNWLKLNFKLNKYMKSGKLVLLDGFLVLLYLSKFLIFGFF